MKAFEVAGAAVLEQAAEPTGGDGFLEGGFESRSVGDARIDLHPGAGVVRALQQARTQAGKARGESGLHRPHGLTRRDLVILASEEYAAAIDRSAIDARLLNCSFRDEKAGKFKVISFFAKRARGMMADFIVRQRITTPAGLRRFNTAGYRFDPDSSTETSFVFLRPATAAAAAAPVPAAAR